jgi:probable F420-dependent oxidoreductase
MATHSREVAMRIGVKVGPGDERSLKHAAEEAERFGFDSIWLSERVVTPLDKPHPYDPMIDPWIGLAFCAAVTERVRLGTSVSQIALRHPVLMARELATIDRLSEGRLIVGAGAGWVIEEFASTGVAFEDRGGRLSEHVRALRHLWTTPDQPFKGKYYDIPPVGIVMPGTPGGPPIWLGAVLPPGMRRAAKYGDGYLSTGAPPEKFAETRATLQALRAKYGRAGAFDYCVQVAPPETIDGARELARSYGEAGATGLILTYPEGVPAGFQRTADAARALIELGASRA